MKQSTFYLNIAFAFLALGLGILLNDMAWAIGQKIKLKNLISSPYTTLSLFALISILSYSGSQFIKRDKDIVSDVKEIKNIFYNLDYSACSELISDWKYYGYLSRYTYSNLNQ